MPIPELNEHGFIPPGTHDVSLAEIQERFCINEHRIRIWRRFIEFYDYILQSGCFLSLEFHGSFVSDIQEPSDIDVALDFIEADPDNRFSNEIFNKELIKERFGVDIILKEPINIAYQILAGEDYRFSSRSLYTFRRRRKSEVRDLAIQMRVHPAELETEEIKGVLKLTMPN